MIQPSKIASISLLLLLSFCTSKQNHQELYFVAIEDFVLGSAHYFPLNRPTYLSSLKKLELERDCKVNIDSLIERWTIPDQYGGSSVACEKYRLIELIEGCGNTGEQRHLYVLVEFYGKWVVEDRLSTAYKF